MPCVLRLICTDSLSHTQTCNLVKDSLRLAQIHPASLSFTQIDLISPRFVQAHPDPPNISQITDSLRSARSHSDPFSLPQICSGSCSPTQIHSDSQNFDQFHSDPVKFPQIPSVTIEFTQLHSVSLQSLSGSHRLILIHSDLFRFTQPASNSSDRIRKS